MNHKDKKKYKIYKVLLTRIIKYQKMNFFLNKDKKKNKFLLPRIIKISENK